MSRLVLQAPRALPERMTMEVMQQIAAGLDAQARRDQAAREEGLANPSPEDLRKARNQRYYERTREQSAWRWKIRRLKSLAEIFSTTGEQHADQ